MPGYDLGGGARFFAFLSRRFRFVLRESGSVFGKYCWFLDSLLTLTNLHFVFAVYKEAATRVRPLCGIIVPGEASN